MQTVTRPIAALCGFVVAFCLLSFASSPAVAQGAAQSSTSADANGRKARALIDKTIQALGGQAYLSMQDMSQEGRSYALSHGETSGMALFWRFYKWPDKDRVELTKQRDYVIIHNGDKGYEITFRGAAEENPKQLQQFLDRQHFSLEHVLRIWINEPGVMLFDDGAAVAERKQAEKITVLNAKNESVSIFIDPQTYLPIKKSYQKRSEIDREFDTEDDVYDNYHLVQGIQTPYDTSRYHNGEMTSQRFLNKVTYNTGLAESLFQPKGPVKPAPKPQ